MKIASLWIEMDSKVLCRTHFTFALIPEPAILIGVQALIGVSLNDFDCLLSAELE
jgi:hypothetical protein